MRRLCIYVTYDFENIADDYIGYMLHELREAVDCLAVVCNYEYIAKGIENIQPYADKIFYRKNIGFDAGAYKDALCQYLGWDIVCQYDELLLVNDSFYGLFYPIEDLFQTIESTDADYWGIIRAPQGRLANGYRYDAHIQSYFLAFKESILKSVFFKKFWELLDYPETLYNAVIDFELGCNRYLSNCGFKGVALTDLYHDSSLFQESEIPYLQHSLELIRDLKIPILKRRGLYFSNKYFDNALKALEYIGDKGFYDITLINKHLERISQSKSEKGMLNYTKLSRFYDQHATIYFYGAGVYGQNLARFFDYKGWDFKSFLVTKMEKQLDNCKVFQDVQINSDDGIIITIGNREICFEILEIVRKQCRDDQILFPNF